MAPSFREHLLPKNATPLERAVSAAAIARVLRAPHNVIRAIAEPDRCPVHILPYLAQAWSVDEWDPAWSEAQKRQAIKDAVWIHRHKGTVGALKRALGQLGMAVTVSEWFQHAGAPYTFRLRVAIEAGATWGREQSGRLLRVAIAAKNVRSFLDRITIVPRPKPMPFGVGFAIQASVRLRYVIEPVRAISTSMTPRIAAGARFRVCCQLRGV